MAIMEAAIQPIKTPSRKRRAVNTAFVPPHEKAQQEKNGARQAIASLPAILACQEEPDKDPQGRCQHSEEEKCAEGMDRGVPGETRCGRNSRRKPIGRIVSKHPAYHQTKPIRSDQERSPCSGSSGVQPPPEASSTEEIEHSGQHKVPDLNPSPVPEREEAQLDEPRVKPRNRVILNEHCQDKEGTGDSSAEQQFTRQRPGLWGAVST